jgi:serine/threonine-protein kinase
MSDVLQPSKGQEDTAIMGAHPPAKPGDAGATVAMSFQQMQDQPAQPGRIGDFIIDHQLGIGAMGAVYLGKHRITGQEAAIKVVTDRNATDPTFIKRFERECALLSRLHHPSIARALNYGTDNGTPYLAMEFVRGRNLSDVLAESKRLDQAWVLQLGIQVARGLSHAYEEAGLIHRDIKPANIILTDDPQVSVLAAQAKIIDFGLAKTVGTGPDAPQGGLTMSGTILGTPHYISPEQIRCEETLTFATDLYALAATMYHLVTGQVPYQRPTVMDVLTSHLSDPVPDPGKVMPDLHPQFRAIIRQAMAKKASQRFSDYRRFIKACSETLDALGVVPDAATSRYVRKLSPATTQPNTETPRPAPRVGTDAFKAKAETPRPSPRVSTDAFRQTGTPTATPTFSEPTPSASHALREITTQKFRRKQIESQRLESANLKPATPIDDGMWKRALVYAGTILVVLAAVALIIFW